MSRASASPPRSRHSAAPASAPARLNRAAAVFLALFLLVAPVPYGAVGPVAWLLFATVLAGFAFMQAVMAAIFDPGRGLQLARFPVIAGLGAAALVLPALQALGAADAGLAVSPQAAALGLVRLISCGLLFAMVLEAAADRTRAGLFLTWIFAGVLLHAVFALIALAIHGEMPLFATKGAHQGFATGTFLNRNSFAAFLNMGMMIGLAQLLQILTRQEDQPGRPERVLRRFTPAAAVWMAMCSILLFALLATGSRLGAVSCLAGGLFLTGAMLRKTGRVSAARLAGLLTVCAMLGICLIWLLLADRSLSLARDAGVRLELFRQAAGMIAQAPLTGHGLDSFGPAFEAARAPGLPTYLVWHRPHNTYLTLWVELGLIAGSIPPLIAGVCFLRMRRLIRRMERSYHIPAACAAAAVACGIHSLGDFSLEVPANTYLFTALMAAGIASHGMSEDRPSA